MPGPASTPFSLILTLLSLTRICSEALEPFSLGVGAGFVAAGGAIYAGWESIHCQFEECCTDAYLPNNVTHFQELTREHLFGQHLVTQVVSRALRSHLKRKQPTKALVLSFHGWTGGGKNYVAKFVAESLYKKGLKSKFVHNFMATLHFPREELGDIYKLNLQDWIRGNVSSCGQSLFIFDEMDKMPEGVIDAIKPFIDHHDNIEGVDFRKTIFLFLSNTGGHEITKTTFSAWEEGRTRNSLALKEFEQLINLGAFNEAGGLYHSAVIERSLVDHFVPFLPLERGHVRQCVEAQGKGLSLTEEEISRVADEMTYWPLDTKVFSNTGCKKVAQKLDMVLEGRYDGL